MPLNLLSVLWRRSIQHLYKRLAHYVHTVAKFTPRRPADKQVAASGNGSEARNDANETRETCPSFRKEGSREVLRAAATLFLNYRARQGVDTPVEKGVVAAAMTNDNDHNHQRALMTTVVTERALMIMTRGQHFNDDPSRINTPQHQTPTTKYQVAAVSSAGRPRSPADKLATPPVFAHPPPPRASSSARLPPTLVVAAAGAAAVAAVAGQEEASLPPRRA